jgi:hypothetical protein
MGVAVSNRDSFKPAVRKPPHPQTDEIFKTLSIFL